MKPITEKIKNLLNLDNFCGNIYIIANNTILLDNLYDNCNLLESVSIINSRVIRLTFGMDIY